MKRIFISVILILTTFGITNVFSKKKMPELPKPILYKGIIYEADQGYNDIGLNYENMGIVKAVNDKTKKELWRKRLYQIKLSKAMEEDVQMVFITDLQIDSIQNGLIIKNELNNTYFVNLKTQESYQIVEFGK